MSGREKARYRRENTPRSGASEAHGTVFQDGQTVQVMGSRETLVSERGFWLSENNDLGGKLDALLAVAKDQLAATERQNEMLETLMNAL